VHFVTKNSAEMLLQHYGTVVKAIKPIARRGKTNNQRLNGYFKSNGLRIIDFLSINIEPYVQHVHKM
jgi:hypothetical protein